MLRTAASFLAVCLLLTLWKAGQAHVTGTYRVQCTDGVAQCKQMASVPHTAVFACVKILCGIIFSQTFWRAVIPLTKATATTVVTVPSMKLTSTISHTRLNSA